MKRVRNTSSSMCRPLKRAVDSECRKAHEGATSNASETGNSKVKDSDSDCLDVSNKLEKSMCRPLKRAVDSECEKVHESVTSNASETGNSKVKDSDLDCLHVSNKLEKSSSSKVMPYVNSCNGIESRQQVSDEISSQSAADDSLSDSESVSDMSLCNSSYSDCDDVEDPVTVTIQLRRWAVEYQMTLAALGGLLKILRTHTKLPDLPKDPIMLLRTGERDEIELMGHGVYYNFGFKKMLLKRLEALKTLDETVSLNFNIGGLRLCKSTDAILWPIMCLVTKSSLPPFFCSVYYGPGKPKIFMLLKDFAPDLNELIDHGIDVNGKHVSVHVNAFVCDTPARAYVKCVKEHPDFWSCERCSQKGQTCNNRTVFLNNNAPLRTDETFLSQNHPEHHTGISPLTDIGVPMVSKFVLDYRHLACLGIMRELLLTWREKKNKKFKLRSKFFHIIDCMMLEAATMWPSDFSRKPGTLNDIKNWKAFELRQFLLYLGPVVLKTYFEKTVYEHFLLFHAAMTIFIREDLHHFFHSEATAMVVEFVRQAKNIYGEEFFYCNVHTLLHIGDDVKNFGALDNVSAFVFANELHKIRHIFKGKTEPLQQLVNRVKSMEKNIPLSENPEIEDGLVPNSEWEGGPTAGLAGGCHFSKYTLNKRALSLRNGDNYVMLKDSSVVVISNFYATSSGLYVIGKRFTKYRNLYDTPIPSDKLGIFVVDKLSHLPRKYKVTKLKSKCLAVPQEQRGAYVIYPLMNKHYLF